jgi:hypothetical protein
VLRMASPEDACLPFTFTDWTSPWIALISRNQPLHTTLNCTFDIKVCVTELPRSAYLDVISHGQLNSSMPGRL